MISPKMRSASLSVFFLLLLACSCSCSGGRGLLDELSLIYKDIYVVYGAGRRSERDLPVCEGSNEACNLAHIRPWLKPITERFCRCRRRAQCPLNYEQNHPPNTQHVSNRSQLKFCEEPETPFEPCGATQTAVEVHLKEKPEGGRVTRTTLFCKCPWPNAFVLHKTKRWNADTRISIYRCNELPRHQTGETCGHVRRDTYAMHYTHSCPVAHLCVFKEPLTNSTLVAQQLALLHFTGDSYEAVCTPK